MLTPNRLAFYSLLAFVVTALLCRTLPKVAQRVGLVDQPGGRKHHEGDVPLIGGIAMFCGFAFAALATGELVQPYVTLVAATALLVVAGVLDDLHDLRPRAKFALQIAAALMMTSWARVYLANLGDLLGFGPVVLRDWSIPFTVVCVLGLLNAMNMLDGVDGLLGSVALVAIGWLALGAWLIGDLRQIAWLALLAAAIAGFLAFNLRLPWRGQARAFMGDAGSTMLGFALVWFSVDLTQGVGPGMSPMVPVWILAVPLLDMARVMLRRWRRGQSMIDGGRDHLHHVLLERGWSVNAIVAAIVAASALCGGIGMLAWQLGVPDATLFYAFLIVLAIYSRFNSSDRAARA